MHFDMKRLIAIIALAAAVVAAATSCKDRFKTNEDVKVGPEISSVELNKHEETLVVPGGTLQLTATVYPEDVTNKKVTWSSSMKRVATVDQNGLVTGHLPGKVDITVTTQVGEKTDVCHLTVKGPDPKAVDLGLSVKWADINVGALSESDPGSYFAWGEVTLKDSYTKDNYKYNVDIPNPPTPPSVLPASEDAAAVNLGGNWRMPTKAELEELLSSCTWERKSVDGMKGWKVSRNGKSIFLPFAGGWDTEQIAFNEKATYFSSTYKGASQSAYEGYFCYAYSLFISDDDREDFKHYIGGFACCYGHSVRAVQP